MIYGFVKVALMAMESMIFKIAYRVVSATVKDVKPMFIANVILVFLDFLVMEQDFVALLRIVPNAGLMQPTLVILV